MAKNVYNLIQACAAVSLDLFKTGANSLLEQTKELQGRKEEAMEELLMEIPGIQDVLPVTQVMMYNDMQRALDTLLLNTTL